jgi:NADH-quinone oxidoreductase subunit N
VTASLTGYHLLVPLLVASAWALLVLVAEMFSTGRRYVGIGWLSLLGLAAVAAFSAQAAGHPGVFGSAIAIDGLTVYVSVLLCGLGGLAIMMAMDYLPVTDIQGGEYYPLILFAVVGLLVMAAATDLIVIFLGLEIMSMAVYVLAGVWKRDLRSNEAALKYFLMGAFASGFLLYGIAMIYAATGSTVLGEVAAAVARPASDGSGHGVLLLGTALLLVGFGFKVAAVPFHLWAPDVYEGAPTSVTAFMATSVKAGAFAALVRTLIVAIPVAATALGGVLWVGAALTMTVGNVVALRQKSLKRMLAYSSVAHTGYLLVGVSAGTPEAGSAILYYLAAYGAMNLGAFGVMMILARRGNGAENISDLAGLGQAQPMLALGMTICMLSLTGIPPLGGFLGKVYIFEAALQAGEVGLVVIAVLNSVLSAAYYLGVVRTMYFESGGLEPSAARPYTAVATAAAVIATILLGVAPSGVLDAASGALVRVVLGP